MLPHFTGIPYAPLLTDASGMARLKRDPATDGQTHQSGFGCALWSHQQAVGAGLIVDQTSVLIRIWTMNAAVITELLLWGVALSKPRLPASGH